MGWEERKWREAIKKEGLGVIDPHDVTDELVGCDEASEKLIEWARKKDGQLSGAVARLTKLLSYQNKRDVRRAFGVIAKPYKGNTFGKSGIGSYIPVGTFMEIACAKQQCKPVIVIDPPSIMGYHIYNLADAIVPNSHEAVNVARNMEGLHQYDTSPLTGAMDATYTSMMKMFTKKHQDYGAAYKLCGESGLTVRLLDKFQRAINLFKKPGKTNFENVSDTYRDAAVYGLMLEAYKRQEAPLDPAELTWIRALVPGS